MTRRLRQQKGEEASRSCLRAPKHTTDVSQSIVMVQPLYPGYCSFKSNKNSYCRNVRPELQLQPRLSLQLESIHARGEQSSISNPSK